MSGSPVTGLYADAKDFWSVEIGTALARRYKSKSTERFVDSVGTTHVIHDECFAYRGYC